MAEPSAALSVVIHCVSRRSMTGVTSFNIEKTNKQLSIPEYTVKIAEHDRGFLVVDYTVLPVYTCLFRVCSSLIILAPCIQWIKARTAVKGLLHGRTNVKGRFYNKPKLLKCSSDCFEFFMVVNLGYPFIYLDNYMSSTCLDYYVIAGKGLFLVNFKYGHPLFETCKIWSKVSVAKL